MTAFTDRHRTPCLALLLGLLCLWLAPVPATADGFRVLVSDLAAGASRVDA